MTGLLILASLPGGFFACLVAFNSVNPMALLFKTEFWVKNNSPGVINVTPIGAIGTEGLRRRLPLLADGPGYWRMPWNAGFAIAPGETRKFVYDWDDSQFSELLIEADGHRRALVVDPQPTVGQYRVSSVSTFTVDAPATLPLASPEIAALADFAVPWFWLYLTASTVTIAVVTARAVVRRKRMG